MIFSWKLKLKHKMKNNKTLSSWENSRKQVNLKQKYKTRLINVTVTIRWTLLQNQVVSLCLELSIALHLLSIFSIQDGLRLLVATEDGVLYIYNFDPTEGGDLQLYKKYLLDDCGADQPDESKGTDSDKPGAGKNFPCYVDFV